MITIEQMSTADRERAQMALLRRWLARRGMPGGRRRSDPPLTLQLVCGCRVPVGVSNRTSGRGIVVVCQTCHYPVAA